MSDRRLLIRVLTFRWTVHTLLGCALSLSLLLVAYAGFTRGWPGAGVPVARRSALALRYEYPIPHEAALRQGGLVSTPLAQSPSSPIFIDEVAIDGLQTYIGYRIAEPARSKYMRNTADLHISTTLGGPPLYPMGTFSGCRPSQHTFPGHFSFGTAVAWYCVETEELPPATTRSIIIGVRMVHLNEKGGWTNEEPISTVTVPVDLRRLAQCRITPMPRSPSYGEPSYTELTPKSLILCPTYGYLTAWLSGYATNVPHAYLNHKEIPLFDSITYSCTSIASGAATLCDELMIWTIPPERPGTHLVFSAPKLEGQSRLRTFQEDGPSNFPFTVP